MQIFAVDFALFFMVIARLIVLAGTCLSVISFIWVKKNFNLIATCSLWLYIIRK